MTFIEKKLIGHYLQLDYNVFLHTFLGILNILRKDKSHYRKTLQLIVFPLIKITSTL
jgi:hypothetical protein